MIGNIYIKKRSFSEWLVLLLVLMPLAYSFLTEFIGLPRNVKFISDLCLIVVSAVILVNLFIGQKLFISRATAIFWVVVLIFLLHTVVGYILNFQSIFYYIWGFRNNFRFYIAFVAFIWFLDKEDVETCFRIIDLLFWIHFAVTLIQYFYYGLSQDYLGGIFGVQKGCNGYTLVFISIVVAKSLLSYMNGTEKSISCFLKCSISLTISAFAELKVFLLIFILILSMATVITRFSLKKYAIILVAVLLISAAYFLLVNLFEGFRGFLSIEYLLNELMKKNYASSEDIGRFTSIPIITERFLPDSMNKIFGLGLGNCDTSSAAIFNTDFYTRYNNIHYSIFSVSFVFLETGFVGLFLFIVFFVICLIQSIKLFKMRNGDLLYNQMGIIVSALCFILMFYNSSLRTEAGYMIYFFLALPFIGIKEKMRMNLEV